MSFNDEHFTVWDEKIRDGFVVKCFAAFVLQWLRNSLSNGDLSKLFGSIKRSHANTKTVRCRAIDKGVTLGLFLGEGAFAHHSIACTDSSVSWSSVNHSDGAHGHHEQG